MHLAVAADDFPGLVDDGGSVVIDAGGATLEDRRDDDDFPRLGHGAERFGGGAGNRLGEIEKFRILDLARVMRAEQLLGADDLRAALGGLLDFGDCLVEIEARLGRTTHLDEPDGDLVGARCHDNCDSNRAPRTPSGGKPILIESSKSHRHRCSIKVPRGTKHFRHRRLHERRCDTVIGRAKGTRAGAIYRDCPPLIAGSCAREGREPRQVRKEATVPADTLCRRGAWLSFDGQSRVKRFRDGRILKPHIWYSRANGGRSASRSWSARST